MGPVEGEHQPDRTGRRRVAGQAGERQRRRGAGPRPEEGEQGLTGAASAAGAVEHQRER